MSSYRGGRLSSEMLFVAILGGLLSGARAFEFGSGLRESDLVRWRRSAEPDAISSSGSKTADAAANNSSSNPLIIDKQEFAEAIALKPYFMTAHYVLICFSIFTIVVGSIFNVINFIVFYRMQKRNTQNIYLMMLSLADLFNIHINLLIPLVRSFDDYEFFKKLTVCRINGYLVEIFLLLPVWIMVILAAERFYCIMCPMKNVTSVPRNAKVTLTVLVAGLMTWSLFKFYTAGVEKRSTFSQEIWFEDLSDCKITMPLLPNISIFMWAVFLPFLTLVLNICIIKRIRKSTEPNKIFYPVHRIKRVNQTTRVVLSLSFIFIISITPNGILIILNLGSSDSLPTHVMFSTMRKYALILYELNMVSTFPVYLYTIKNFRETLTKMAVGLAGSFMLLARTDSTKIGKSMNGQPAPPTMPPNRPRYSLYRLSNHEIMQYNRKQMNLNKRLLDKNEANVISVVVKSGGGGGSSRHSHSHSHSGGIPMLENESSHNFKNSRGGNNSSCNLDLFNNSNNKNLPFEIAILNDTGADIIENNIKIVMKDFAGGVEAERRGSLNLLKLNKSNKIVDNCIEINHPILPASKSAHKLSGSGGGENEHCAGLEAVSRFNSFVLIDKTSSSNAANQPAKRPNSLFNVYGNGHGVGQHEAASGSEREPVEFKVPVPVMPLETPIRNAAPKQVGLFTRLNRYFQEYLPNSRAKKFTFRSKRTESKTPILFYKDGACTTRLTLCETTDLIKMKRLSGKSVSSRTTNDTKLSMTTSVYRKKSSTASKRLLSFEHGR